ncbi:hypothetical protein PINS_up003070 [Pythium insidiosum]|nr:hypothetical protein PINS_up003070 [Pythium insidiosum]
MRVDALQHFEPPCLALLGVLEALVDTSFERFQPSFFTLQPLCLATTTGFDLVRCRPCERLCHVVQALLEVKDLRVNCRLVHFLVLCRLRPFVCSRERPGI